MASFPVEAASVNLHQGPLAGESLQLCLMQMDKAFMDQNDRRLEVEKTISLVQLDPGLLSRLKATGFCRFSLGEADFDFDYPGRILHQIERGAPQ